MRQARYKQKCFVVIAELLNYKPHDIYMQGKLFNEVVDEYKGIGIMDDGKTRHSKLSYDILFQLAEEYSYEEIYYSIMTSIDEINKDLKEKYYPTKDAKARWVFNIIEKGLPKARRDLKKIKKIRELKAIREERLKGI